MADSIDRTTGKSFLENILIPCKQINQFCIVQSVAYGEIRFLRFAGETVPRAHQLAIIAPIDAVADQRTQFLRNAVLEFNGEIGDATWL